MEKYIQNNPIYVNFIIFWMDGCQTLISFRAHWILCFSVHLKFSNVNYICIIKNKLTAYFLKAKGDKPKLLLTCKSLRNVPCGFSQWFFWEKYSPVLLENKLQRDLVRQGMVCPSTCKSRQWSWGFLASGLHSLLLMGGLPSLDTWVVHSKLPASC